MTANLIRLSRPALVLALGAATLLEAAAGPAPRRLARETLEDKIRGGWAGKMFGVSYGAPAEFRSNGNVELRIAQVDVGLPAAFRRLLQGVAPAALVRKLERKLPQRSIRWEFGRLRCRARASRTRKRRICPAKRGAILPAPRNRWKRGT